MTPFTSILVATDFSIDGNNAVRRAALLAHEHGARLKLVHVLDRAGCKPLRDWFSPSIDIDLKAPQARESLRRFAVEIAGRYDVPVSVEVMVGEPLETLAQASEHAELLVLGRRGHRRFQALVVGRTSDRMLRTCRCPVLVVKAPVEGPYRCVLVPVDFTASSDAVVQVAARLSGNSGMHVFMRSTLTGKPCCAIPTCPSKSSASPACGRRPGPSRACAARPQGSAWAAPGWALRWPTGIQCGQL